VEQDASARDSTVDARGRRALAWLSFGLGSLSFGISAASALVALTQIHAWGMVCRGEHGETRERGLRGFRVSLAHLWQHLGPSILPFVFAALAVVALWLGILALRPPYEHRGIAQAGIALGSFTIVWTLLSLLVIAYSSFVFCGT
jgi:hypothetical protein